MGLDKDDEIVKRRMAQKMQFLAEDVAAAREPTTGRAQELVREEQRQVRAAAAAQLPASLLLARPARRARARRCGSRRWRSSPASRRTRSSRARSPTRSCSRSTTATARRSYLGKEFGPQFALAVAKLPPGSWQGPIESGFGWHLVFVDTVIPGRVPAFEEVEADVKTAWLGEQKALAWEKAYKEMRAKYTVLLPGAAREFRGRVVFADDESGPRHRARCRSDRRAPHRRIRRSGAARRCSPDCRRRARTSRARPISRSRKPRPASSACSGARRCSRACACRSR